ncbi:predicted protein [Naegleria gruberi]|uniref:Predicted protein n=1 Tax=Naegleria gruberi TaxID=5762 RepID=D2VT31_NAEGR|nr:uncharacterized protein NAEGRDRAFT_72155 [Naegleria gruberi]EFC40076.1 predicted protein [Naegleria gruberi]|eukprot:XP_002672820.1 predicted protein [Naegleria gruberi strain NEG-M]
MLFSQERTLKQRREMLKSNPQMNEDQHILLRHWFQKQRTYNLYCSLHLCFWIGLSSLLLIGLGSVSLALIVQISNPTIKSSVNDQNDATKSGLLQMGAAFLGVSCGLCILGCIPMYIIGSYLIHIFRNKEESSTSIEGKSHEAHIGATPIVESKYVLISNQDLDDEGMEDDEDDIMLIQRATVDQR